MSRDFQYNKTIEMKIIPAILTNSADDLKQQVDHLTPHFQYFQVDVMDKEFLQGIQTVLTDFIAQKKLIFDLDLLAETLLVEAEKTNLFQTIFVHDLDSFVAKPNMGIAIDPQISVEAIKQRFDIHSISVIQIMSVTPGAQGRAFIPETLHKIEQLRKAGYRNKVYLDGGINNETIPLILSNQYQPDALCVGSYLSKAEDLQQRVNELRKI